MKLTILPASTRDEIVHAFDRVRVESAAYWSAFDDATFFAKIGQTWSPAENVRHLAKSTRPVAKALRMPKLVLRFMFGKARRPSLDYESLRAQYLGKLDEGGGAGRFAPSPREERDRAAILAQLDNAMRDVAAAIAQWNDRQLDRLQLPHPLLGKLTVREMLLFTLYHQQHHIGNVERRRAE